MASDLSSTVVPPPPPARHDIFLSHAGEQKDFAKALYESLKRASYSTFMDITHHSLPPGEHFPSRISTAARTCRVAILVLSEEYVQKKWPMAELCMFISAQEQEPKPKIIPLFLKLSVSELKKGVKDMKWLRAWQAIADEDRLHEDWRLALKKIPSYSGIPIRETEGEHAYINRVCSIICQNCPSAMMHDLSGYHGLSRMSQLVLSKVEELKAGDSRTISVLGMHGPRGSGKTSICKFLYNHLFTQFHGKALLLQLPTNPNQNQLLREAKKLLRCLTDFNDMMSLQDVSGIEQVYTLLKRTNFSSTRVFLVVDNISLESVEVVRAVLNLGLEAGSVVLLVACTVDILHLLLKQGGPHRSCNWYAYGSMKVPGLTSTEALRVLLQPGGGVGLPDSYEPEADLTHTERRVAEEVLRIYSFYGGGREGEYIPSVLKHIGYLLSRWLERRKRQLENASQELVLSRELFLNVALFVLPLTYYQYCEGWIELGLTHGCSTTEMEVKALVAWVEDEEVPLTLREASMRALEWELFENLEGRERTEMVVRKHAIERYQTLGGDAQDDGLHCFHGVSLWEKLSMQLHKLVLGCFGDRL